MKALTLTQPWATLVASGHKTVETRSWRTSYRGPLVIHAAKRFPRYARDFATEERACGRLSSRVPLAAVVAVALLDDCIPTEEYVPVSTALERRLGDYTWGRWAWVFDRGGLWVPPEPIPYLGALGLWEFPDELLAEFYAAVPA